MNIDTITLIFFLIVDFLSGIVVGVLAHYSGFIKVRENEEKKLTGVQE